MIHNHRRIEPARRNKLPVYAQDYIGDLEREISRLEDRIDSFHAKNEESPISFQPDYDDSRNVYVATDRVTITAKDKTVSLRVQACDDKIELSWCAGAKPWHIDEVAFIPSAHQQARLVAPQHIRVVEQ